MKPKPNLFLFAIALATAALSSSTFGADRIKLDNADNLNLASSWDTLPGSGDIAVWNSTVSGASSVLLGGNLSWGGLRIDNPGGDVTIGGANSLTLGASGLNTGSSRNLTLNNTGSVTMSGPLAGSTILTINSNATRNWSTMTSTSFTGTLVLRGGSGASGAFSNNWLAFGAASVSQTGSFHLDTGASLTNRGEFILTDGWGDGTTKPKLALASLTGFGDFRSDWGANTFRTVLVDQAVDTTFSGRFVSNSGSRGIDLEKAGSGTLTLTGVSTHRYNTVVGGTIKLGGASALGAADKLVTRTNISSGGTVDLNAIATTYGFTIAGTGVGGNGALVNNGAAIGNNLAQTSNLKLSADASIGGSGNWSLLTAGYAATSLDLNAATLTKTGANTIALASTTATAGTIRISAGTLAFGVSNGGSGVAADNVALSLDNVAGAGLSVARDSTLGSLSGGGGTGGNVSLGAVLTVGSLGSSTSYSGVVSGGGSLTKTGAGTLTLSGENAYQNTIVGAGKLQIGNGGSSGNIGSGTVSVAGGSTLEFNRSGLLDYKASARMRTVSGAGDIVLDGGVKIFNYTGSGIGFAEANSWNNFSGKLIVKGGSEFQTIRNGATAMGTGDIVLGDGSSSGKLSQIEGNWTWTNNIQLVGSANEIINNSTGGSRYNKLQGVISGSGNVTFKDSTGAMNDGNLGFILTGANTMSGVVTVDTFVRVGGVAGNDSSAVGGASGSLGSASVVLNSGKRLTFSRTDSHTVANSISGAGDLHVGSTGITGTNTQVLTYTGTATYTGATSVNAGTFLVNGSLGNTTVGVNSGATLGGTGTIAGAVNVSGVLSPGASVETLATGTLSFATGSTFAYEVDSTVGLGAGADLQKVTGSLNLSGLVELTLVDLATGGPAAAFAQNTVFSLINYTGSWNSGTFTYDGNSLADGSTFTAGLNTWQIDYAATSGGSNFAGEYVSGNFVNITAVPEPPAALLGGIGLLLLLRRRRRI